MSGDKVVELPDSMQRQWRVVAKGLTQWLLEEGLLAPAEVDALLQVVRPVYLRWAQPKTFKADGLTAAEYSMVISDYFSQLLHGLLTEIAAREVELIRAGLRG